MVIYYRTAAILVILGIALRLFIRGVGCNNLDYNIELVCESCCQANSFGYLVRVLIYSNLILCIFTVPRGGVIIVLWRLCLNCLLRGTCVYVYTVYDRVV
jgi:hypothetical protein